MSLPLFLQRLRQQSAPPVADASPLSSADIEVARVRARRRLVGMVVLVGVGVVGLPWLFETQPRPLSPDVQVVSAASSRGNGAVVPSRPAPAIASVTVPVPDAPVESAQDEVEAPVASKPSPARAQVSQTVVAKPAPAKEAPKKEPAKPVVVAEKSATQDAARAKSLLEGKPPVVNPAVVPSDAKSVAKPASDAAATRYVVQIGAFSDVPTAREVRLKAERAGVKTYTQEVTVNGGKKIRVRVGPYANKAEADKAVDTLRKAGMTSALLTL
ncbi:SPOR domain-containing protein [Aquabacterium sp.]|uniref:SPOR domain-containing protein n=1 Tax=Aquabacterium sp. TaxID=1872578 RepID=UPI0019B8C008|nr:SPOR domain-containing protein [Aquabacterium sp.]MBC7702311.1 SPOR domain-containing protein [Aquabacterium sp.]